MIPAPTPSPVPTSQRPLNGAVLSGTSLLVYGLATYLGAPVEVAVPASLVVGGALSTIGDAARKRIENRPPESFVGEIALALLARIG